MAILDLDQLTPDDIAALSNTIAASWGKDDLGVTIDLDWFDLESDRPGEVARRFGTRNVEKSYFAAYGEVVRAPSSSLIKYLVHPDQRSAGNNVERALLAHALDLADTTVPFSLWTREAQLADDEVADELGLVVDRELAQLARDLPVEFDSDRTLPIRTFRPGLDDAQWLQVNNRAFSGHPEQGNWDLDTFLARQHEPWFDANGILLFEQQGVVAGFCWTRVHAGTPAIGEVYVMAIDPSFQGKGLGKLLAKAALAYLFEAGCTKAMLYVDCANESGMALYQSLGFAMRHRDRAYRKHVR